MDRGRPFLHVAIAAIELIHHVHAFRHLAKWGEALAIQDACCL